MARLADTALIGGERSDATDHCLAGIARLSSEVKDASSYLPTYDQRTYAEVAFPLTTALITKYNGCRQSRLCKRSSTRREKHLPHGHASPSRLLAKTHPLSR